MKPGEKKRANEASDDIAVLPVKIQSSMAGLTNRAASDFQRLVESMSSRYLLDPVLRNVRFPAAEELINDS